jgi:stage II sporulation protein D
MGNSGVRFRVTGYGHGVGMCQYGADGMARRGASYRTILTHYYQGIRFVKIKY